MSRRLMITNENVVRADAIAGSVDSADCSEAWELAHRWSEFTDGDCDHAAMSQAIVEAIEALRGEDEQ